MVKNNTTTTTQENKTSEEKATKEVILVEDCSNACELVKVIDGDYEAAAEGMYDHVWPQECTEHYGVSAYEVGDVTIKGTDYADIHDNADPIKRLTVTVHPAEPHCEHPEGHNWTATHEVEGGLPSNPGVFSNGITYAIDQHCTRCPHTKSESRDDDWRITIEYGTGDHEFGTEEYRE